MKIKKKTILKFLIWCDTSKAKCVRWDWKNTAICLFCMCHLFGIQHISVAKKGNAYQAFGLLQYSQWMMGSGLIFFVQNLLCIVFYSLFFSMDISTMSFHWDCPESYIHSLFLTPSSWVGVRFFVSWPDSIMQSLIRFNVKEFYGYCCYRANAAQGRINIILSVWKFI